MAEQKYAKNIITTWPHPPFIDKEGRPRLHPILGLSSRVLEGAFMVNCSWMFAGEDPGRMDAHTHSHDEVIGFIGTNPEDPNDLGAEAELWMEDEKYIIKSSCLIFVPKGLKHCPLIVRDIKRPVFHFDIQMNYKPAVMADYEGKS